MAGWPSRAGRAGPCACFPTALWSWRRSRNTNSAKGATCRVRWLSNGESSRRAREGRKHADARTRRWAASSRVCCIATDDEKTQHAAAKMCCTPSAARVLRLLRGTMPSPLLLWHFADAAGERGAADTSGTGHVAAVARADFTCDASAVTWHTTVDGAAGGALRPKAHPPIVA